ncbi:MAG: S8 family serine peptidase [Patescibacteria group bacterium]
MLIFIEKYKKILLYYFVTLLLCFACFGFIDLANALTQKITANYKTGELLVKFTTSKNIFKFKFSDEIELDELLHFYNSQDSVEYAEPNYIYHASLEPSDTFYTQQLYISKIKANKAWDITTGSKSVVVAIIDSGVDLAHPDLEQNIWFNKKEKVNNSIDDDKNGYIDDIYGWDFIGNDNDPNPDLSAKYTEIGIRHGTVVAGIATAQGGNKEGIAGVSWLSKIMVLRVLDGEGYGTTDKVALAIDYAVDNKADIINLSFIGTGKSLTLERAIKRAYDAGIIVVAAAGNEVASGVDMDIEGNLEYPVCHDGPNGENWVLGVASVDNSDILASFSNYGSKCVDLVAPGVRLFSTVFHSDSNNNFKEYYQNGWTGTSVSAPQVAGAVALIKGIKPSLSSDQVKEIILESAHNIDYLNPVYKTKLGAGLLDVYQAITNTLDKEPEYTSKKELIITAAGPGGGPHVKSFRKDYLENEFFAFDAYYVGGLSIASADLEHNGSLETVVGLGRGTHPWFKIYNSDGKLRSQFLAYDDSFRGGVEVAIGDLDGDGIKEIITGAGKGGGPHVRIFSATGQLMGQFFALDKNFRGGIELALGDLNGDDKDEILVVAQSNNKPEVLIFDSNGNLLNKFLAFKNFIGSNFGLHIATGDIDGNGEDEIIVGAGYGGGPQVKIFDMEGNLASQFFAYAEGFRGGVYVASGDTDANGIDEIIVGAGPGGGPHVRVLDEKGGLYFQFFAYVQHFRGGVRVTSEN